SATGNEGQKSYAVTGSMVSPYLIDITDLRNQRILSPTVSVTSLKFTLELTSASGREFALVNASAMAKPFSIAATQIDDIRSTANAADLIIVTHDNFYSQALDFAAYRQSRDGIRVRVVKVSDVYAQFSGGMVDPIAIRDFLRYAFGNWSGAKPSFCLLAGDGVYDLRNNLRTNAVSYIPPFIVENDSTISDENYCYFGQLFDLDSDNSDPADRGVDMVIARWPVKTVAEFQTVAEKIKSYDTGSNAGTWRNLITLIADDQNHPSSGPEIGHTIDSETLARGSIPGKFDLDKIYGIEYPYGSAGEKPEMREAIVRSINSGTLLVNYIGHGNPNVWADEHVFRRLQDIPRLTNSDRLPLIFNASCSIGFFDDPVSEGMAEDFLRYAGGGAVGTVSATRQVFSRPNADFNQQAFTQLFGGKNYTIAEAVFVAKLLRQGSGGTDDNDRKYIYIGDPLTRLAVAPLKIDFTGDLPRQG
ncbi:MAG: C25 family cysteine peptidase, partial [candidate division Zixibacteria bacterium]|nr:C25 family cysteine peptidase [candidate division Zixibacteria bacterium]